jgi:hypothetical protein
MAEARKGLAVSNLEGRLQCKDGRPINVSVSTSPVSDNDGNHVEVRAAFIDITDRKKDEEQLKSNMEDLERFSDMTVGREEKMIQLKEEINELMVKSGKEEKYKIVS